MLTVSGARLVWSPTVLGARGLARWMKLSVAAAILGNWTRGWRGEEEEECGWCNA